MPPHLNGFIGYVMQTSEGMTQTKYHIWRHLQKVKVQHSFTVEDSDLDQVSAWAHESCAILFFADSTVRSPNGKVLIYPDGSDQDPEAYIPYPKDAVERKLKTEEKLKSMGLSVAPTLPPVIGEPEVNIREGQEIALRAYALFMLALRGEALATKEKLPIKELKKRLPMAFQALTKDESIFIKTKQPDQQSIINMAWRYESLQLLMWALGLQDELAFPDKICDVKTVARTMFDLDHEAYLAFCPVRETADILDELDLTLRLHWCTREAQRLNQTIPAELDPGVLQERHLALNWLVHFEEAEWDEVETPT